MDIHFISYFRMIHLNKVFESTKFLFKSSFSKKVAYLDQEDPSPGLGNCLTMIWRSNAVAGWSLIPCSNIFNIKHENNALNFFELIWTHLDVILEKRTPYQHSLWSNWLLLYCTTSILCDQTIFIILLMMSDKYKLE